MLILGVDPGTRMSGFSLYDSGRSLPLSGQSGWLNNESVISIIMTAFQCGALVVIERPTLYGKGGEALVETVIWAGRFFQEAGLAARFMTRGEVCKHWSVNGLGKGKDAIINQKLVDRYGGIDGKKKAVGTKAAPGPLFGVTGHSRQALALAIAYAETKITKGEEF